MTIEINPTDTALDDQRTISISPLVAPSLLRREHAADDAVSATVRRGRDGVVDILDGRDDRHRRAVLGARHCCRDGLRPQARGEGDRTR